MGSHLPAGKRGGGAGFSSNRSNGCRRPTPVCYVSYLSFRSASCWSRPRVSKRVGLVDFFVYGRENAPQEQSLIHLGLLPFCIAISSYLQGETGHFRGDSHIPASGLNWVFGLPLSPVGVPMQKKNSGTSHRALFRAHPIVNSKGWRDEYGGDMPTSILCVASMKQQRPVRYDGLSKLWR